MDAKAPAKSIDVVYAPQKKRCPKCGIFAAIPGERSYVSSLAEATWFLGSRVARFPIVEIIFTRGRSQIQLN